MVGEGWEKKKYRFLASCIELSEALRVGPKFVSHLPILFDATASGIQHQCAMNRSDEGVEVNLAPGNVPRDIHQKVCDVVQDEMLDEIEECDPNAYSFGYIFLFDRSVLKQPVMTRFYNSPLGGTAMQIMNKREQGGWPIDFKTAYNLARRTRDATDRLLPKSLEVNEFLGKCAKALAEQNKPLRWTSPSGVPISVRCYPPSTTTIEIRSSGRPHWHIVADGYEPVIDKGEAINSASSNFVHSCDAAHLAFVTNRAVREGIADLAAVHDCFGCPAAQAVRFREIIREEFVRMYESHDVLAELRAAVARDLGTDRDLPELPTRGKLDLRGILHSEFAFD